MNTAVQTHLANVDFLSAVTHHPQKGNEEMANTEVVIGYSG
jgi:hypothetical protein